MVDREVVSTLRQAVRDCSDRGLFFASKWASELLISIPKEKRIGSEEPPSVRLTTEQVDELKLEEQELDELQAAKAFAEAKEFQRAAYILRDCQSARAQFLRIHNEFIAAEKKALRDWHNLDMFVHPKNPNQPPAPINHRLLELFSLLQNAVDPWLLFMKGLLLKRLLRREEAIEALIMSLRGYLWNWSAWLLLGSCLGDGDELGSIIPLLPVPPTHPLVQLFKIKILNELHHSQDNEIELCDRLLGPDFFPDSVWIMSLRASALYHVHDFSRAEAQFDKIVEMDPYRLNDIDTLSNILYVAENRTKLSKLTHHYLAIDKDRPEVCCMVGNHYSLRQEPDRAIEYFRRATELDQSYLTAWTLMGHEYVELKNSHAAIESYRRAIDSNRKDYRAWYGLGQAYELLSMHQYALHYYQRATALKPYDVRVWQAQGMCYEEMGRIREAIECFKRALIGADPRETNLNYKLARLHDEIEEYAEAAAYHQRVYDIVRADGKPMYLCAKSCIAIARYHMERGGNDLQLAKECLEKVTVGNSEDVQQAVELLKKLKDIMPVNIPQTTGPPSDVIFVNNSDHTSG